MVKTRLSIVFPLYKLPLLLALVLCLPSVSPAYEGDPISNAVTDLGYIQRAPERLLNDPAGAYQAGAILVVGSSASFINGLNGAYVYSDDVHILKIVQRNKTADLENVSKATEKIGNGLYEALFLGGLAGAGYALGDDKLKDTAFLSAESFLAANAVGTVLKYAVGRARPYHGDGKRAFLPFSFKNEHASFPSGHTTSAFSIASVIAARYDSLWIGALVYSAASASALQRAYSNNHWPSDVFFGAVLGTVTGRAVVRLADGRAAKPGSVAVLPVFSPAFSGALASVSF